jgi:hypothetical protein
MKTWVGGSCDAKSKTGREDVSSIVVSEAVIIATDSLRKAN